MVRLPNNIGMATEQPVQTSREEASFHHINDVLMKIAKMYVRQHEKNQDFGVQARLQRAEIHTIQAIGNHEGINLTELARLLEVTKPTISERVAKLARLKLVEKQMRAGNQKEVRLVLTETGWTAYHHHEDQHREIFRLFQQHFGGRSAAVLQSFEKELDDFHGFLVALRKGSRFFQ